MFSRNRFLAGASAVALAAGTTLAAAGVASAQDEDESTGSLGSSSINLGEIAGDLETAAEALNGPVTVVPNDEGGPTVTYSNESALDQRCLGATAPYSTIVDNDLDTDYPEGDLEAGINLITAIEAGGGLTHLLADAEGNPTVELDDPEVGNNVVQNVLPFVFGQPGRSVLVEAGTDVTWTALSPETSAVGIVLCVPVNEDDTLGGLETNFGIDPQVVADQINGRIPGGSVEPVSAGSISGGSVASGATVLGSLGAASSDNDAEEPPVEEPPVEEPAE